MNNGLFTYLAALLLFGSNGIIAAAIALPSSDIVLLRTFLGALSLVTVLAITQRHKLQAPSRPREAAALLLSGAALGASWIFLFRAYQTIGVGVSSLLYYCGPIIVMALSPLIFGEKLTGGKITGFIAVACGAFLIAAQGLGGNMPIAGIVCGIASAFCYALMVIASKGAPHIEGLENSTLQVSAAFVTALILTLFTQGAPLVPLPQHCRWHRLARRCHARRRQHRHSVACSTLVPSPSCPSRPSRSSATSSRFRPSCSRPSFWAKP